MIKKWIGVFVAVSVVLALVVVLGGTGCAKPAEETYDWKMSQPYPTGTALAGMVDDIISRVADASDGRITITHYPGDLLGDYEVQQLSVASGSQEMCFTWPMSSANPKWDVMWLGYMNYNYVQAYEAYSLGGWLGSLFDEISAESNWKLTGMTLGGAASVISNDLFDPLNPGGIKIRVQPAKCEQSRFKALGYSPVTMSMSEVAAALATGAIDASSGCAPEEFAIYGDAFTYLYAYNYQYSGVVGITNLDLWNSLSASDQKIILDATAAATDIAYQKFGEDIASAWNDDLLDWQKIISFDGDMWATCAEKARAAEWTLAEEWIGKDFMDSVRANAVPLPWGLTIDEVTPGFGVLTTDWIIARQGEVITGP